MGVTTNWLTDLYVLSTLWISGTFYLSDATPVSMCFASERLMSVTETSFVIGIDLTENTHVARLLSRSLRK